MPGGKSVSGWVLAMVALGLFAILLMRNSQHDDATSPAEQASAGMVMTGNKRAAALDFSAAFEAITAQYVHLVVAIHPQPLPRLHPTTLGPGALYEDFSFSMLEESGRLVAPIFLQGNGNKPSAEAELGFGCGVVVSSDGYILTNHHILSSSTSGPLEGDSVTVVLHRGRRFTGIIVGTDPLTDLALIKIPAKGLPYAKWGDSDRLRVGQWVIAIGNFIDHSHAVTAGIICAKGRAKVTLPYFDDFIRMDASIHAGNSGGALVNFEGELVGINTALFEDPAQSTMLNSGFAIPSNLARRVFQSLQKDGKVTRGFVGLGTQDMDQALAKALNLESVMGALIFSVTPDGPADQAGLRRGDVVLQFAGEPVRNAKELQNLIALQPPGQAVPAVVWRDSVKIVCEITPEAWPTSAMAEPAPIPRNKVANKLGIQVRGLAAQVARQQNLRGVTISHLDPGGPAEHVLSTGDIIMEINRKTVNNVRDFQAALHQLQSGQTALLLVHRGEQTFFVGVEAL